MSQPVQVKCGDTRWEVLPECRDRLLGPDGLRLAEWLCAGLARVVKHGPFRTVYRVALPGLRFYLKHYRLPDVRSWLRQLVRPSKGRLEYRRALAVAARQIPTAEPLALGERAGRLPPGDSFLITRSLDDTEPLNTFLETTFPRLEACRQPRVRQRLAGELGRLLARMHDAGLAHHDLHAGNLLVRLDGDRPDLYVIDLHAARLGRPLTWRASRANLVLLNRWFVLRASRADRLRFWRAYCRARQGEKWHTGEADGERQKWFLPLSPFPLFPSLRDLARDLEARTWESNHRFWQSRDRRCRATNKYYRRVRSGVASGYAVADLAAAALAGLLADPDEPFRRPGTVLLKDGRSSTVAELDLPVAGVPRRVIYKRFRVRAWSDPWLALVRPSAALRSWVRGHGLRERGLPTPRPLAVFHRRRHGLPGEGYLVTEKVPAAVDLRRFVAGLDRLTPADRRDRLRALIDQVARLVRELHRRRLSHRDLKAANVLVSTSQSPAQAAAAQPPTLNCVPAARGAELWLIDLVGVTCRRKLTRARRVQNLARLHASFLQHAGLTRTDKLRFLRAYLQWGLRGRCGWKRWWRETEAATRAKVARNLRSGRPLA
jgi:tRNA A-37 threonylcarbamoyl transferase component Bud32